MALNGRSSGIKQYGVRMAGVGHFVPERRLTNRDFEQMFETSDDWIVSRTGMRERGSPSPMCRSACSGSGLRAAFSSARTLLRPISIASSSRPSRPISTFPATACIIAAEPSASRAAPASTWRSAAAVSFTAAIASYASLIRTGGVFRRVMLIGAEKLSSLVNYQDRATAILFGDGAGAAILERSEEDSFLGSCLGSDGSNPEVLYLPAGGSRERITAEGIERKRDTVHMRGREVFKFAVTKMVESATDALGQSGLTPHDVKWFIPHQANGRIIEAAAKYLDLPLDRVVVNIANYDNTSSASIPIAFSEALDRNAFKAGDVLLFTAFGAGLSRARSPGSGRGATSDARRSHFPRQGSQFVGMGGALAETFPVAAELYERANEIVGYDLRSFIIERGPEELLRETHYSQPAIFLVNYALFAAVGEALRPVASAANLLRRVL